MPEHKEFLPSFSPNDMQELCQIPSGPVLECTPLSNPIAQGEVSSHARWLGMSLGNSDKVSHGLTNCPHVDGLLISTGLLPRVSVLNNGVDKGVDHGVER